MEVMVAKELAIDLSLINLMATNQNVHSMIGPQFRFSAAIFKTKRKRATTDLFKRIKQEGVILHKVLSSLQKVASKEAG